MKYSVTADNKLKIDIVGELDIVNADQFKTDCIELVEREKKNVILDCKELEFVDSTALGSFVALNKYIEGKGLKLTLINLKTRIQKLFQITSLSTIIDIR